MAEGIDLDPRILFLADALIKHRAQQQAIVPFIPNPFLACNKTQNTELVTRCFTKLGSGEKLEKQELGDLIEELCEMVLNAEQSKDFFAEIIKNNENLTDENKTLYNEIEAMKRELKSVREELKTLKETFKSVNDTSEDDEAKAIMRKVMVQVPTLMMLVYFGESYEQGTEYDFWEFDKMVKKSSETSKERLDINKKFTCDTTDMKEFTNSFFTKNAENKNIKTTLNETTLNQCIATLSKAPIKQGDKSKYKALVAIWLEHSPLLAENEYKAE